MSHAVNRRTWIGGKTAVSRAGRAEVRRQAHLAHRLEPVSAQAKKHFGITAQPPYFCANGGGAVGSEDGGEGRADAVHLVVAASHRANMVGARAVKTLRAFKARRGLHAFGRPTGRVAL